MPVGKAVLRDILKTIRWDIPKEDRAQKSEIICRYLQELVSIGDNVLVYCTKTPEVDTRSFIEYLLSNSIRTAVPIIQKEDTSLRLSYIQDPSVLITSTFSVPEPIGNEIPVLPEEINVAILPVLGFDRSGTRLGYGGGYYDRFLKKNPDIRRIGIAYSDQERPFIPPGVFDIRMQIIVTEKGIFYCGEDE